MEWHPPIPATNFWGWLRLVPKAAAQFQLAGGVPPKTRVCTVDHKSALREYGCIQPGRARAGMVRHFPAASGD